MAAGTFKIFDKAKGKLCNGTFDLDTNDFQIGFFRPSAAAELSADSTISTFASISGACSARGGWTGSAESLSGETWTTGASAGIWRFDANDFVLTASGSQISDIQFAVIKQAGGQALCFVTLSTGAFDLASGNTLTVAFNSSGIFTLA